MLFPLSTGSGDPQMSLSLKVTSPRGRRGEAKVLQGFLPSWPPCQRGPWLPLLQPTASRLRCQVDASLPPSLTWVPCPNQPRQVSSPSSLPCFFLSAAQLCSVWREHPLSPPAPWRSCTSNTACSSCHGQVVSG
jgi:hypothetical protein